MAYTFVFFDTREFKKDLTVFFLKHLDVGRNNTILVDTSAEHVRRVVDAVVDLFFKFGLNGFVVVATADGVLEEHREVGLAVDVAIFLAESADVVVCFMFGDEGIGCCEGFFKSRVVFDACHRTDDVGHRHLENHVHTALEVEAEAYAHALYFVECVAQIDFFFSD